MGDRVLIKERYLKIINPQKKKIIAPDVMLHTRDVMIPVIKPVRIKQNFNVLFSENKPQILKIQNYKNNPALLFSETPSYHTYNQLRNLLQVKEFKHRKSMSAKYIISGKTDLVNTEKTSISQNSYLSKRLPCKKKNSTLHLFNTMFVPLTNHKELHKISSKSKQLSRKCSQQKLQMRINQIKEKDKFGIIPKKGAQYSISNVMNKQIISLPNESFYNIAYTVSTVSTSTLSNFKIRNKKTFTNIKNKEKLISRTISYHLHRDKSEYEINVLHYEDHNLTEKENKPTHFDISHLNAIDINWSPAENTDIIKIQNDNENFNKKKNVIKEDYEKWDVGAICDVKYSWKAIDSWVPPSQKIEYKNPYKIKDTDIYSEKPYDCKIKYSWQIIGTNTQTSYSLLQDLLTSDDIGDHKSTYKMCTIKYSWQIIGISTQASLNDYNDPDYWNGILLTSSHNGNSSKIDNKTDRSKLQDTAKYSERRSRKYLILNNQQTQTFAEKDVQADDYYAKYSWHNLIKR